MTEVCITKAKIDYWLIRVSLLVHEADTFSHPQSLQKSVRYKGNNTIG